MQRQALVNRKYFALEIQSLKYSVLGRFNDLSSGFLYLIRFRNSKNILMNSDKLWIITIVFENHLFWIIVWHRNYAFFLEFYCCVLKNIQAEKKASSWKIQSVEKPIYNNYYLGIFQVWVICWLFSMLYCNYSYSSCMFFDSLSRINTFWYNELRTLNYYLFIQYWFTSPHCC